MRKYLLILVGVVLCVAGYAIFASQSSRFRLDPDLAFLDGLPSEISDEPLFDPSAGSAGVVYPARSMKVFAPAQEIAHLFKVHLRPNANWQVVFPDMTSYGARAEKLPLTTTGSWSQGTVEVVLSDNHETYQFVSIIDYAHPYNWLQTYLYKLRHRETR